MLALLLFLAGPSVAIRTSPNFCTEPCRLSGLVFVEEYPVGQEVCFELYDIGFTEPGQVPWRRSCWTHTGRKVTDVLINNVPEGEYAVYGVLSQSGKRSNRTTLRVMPRLGAR